MILVRMQGCFCVTGPILKQINTRYWLNLRLKKPHFLIVSNDLLVFNQKAAPHRGENHGLSSQTDSISGPEFSIYLLCDPRQSTWLFLALMPSFIKRSL